MAFIRVATITRQWGGGTGSAMYAAHRAPINDTVSAPAHLLVGTYESVGEAMNAVQASFPGRTFKWDREDLAGDIESYVGSVALEWP